MDGPRPSLFEVSLPAPSRHPSHPRCRVPRSQLWGVNVDICGAIVPPILGEELTTEWIEVSRFQLFLLLAKKAKALAGPLKCRQLVPPSAASSAQRSDDHHMSWASVAGPDAGTPATARSAAWSREQFRRRSPTPEATRWTGPGPGAAHTTALKEAQKEGHPASCPSVTSRNHKFRSRLRSRGSQGEDTCKRTACQSAGGPYGLVTGAGLAPRRAPPRAAAPGGAFRTWGSPSRSESLPRLSL